MELAKSATMDAPSALIRAIQTALLAMLGISCLIIRGATRAIIAVKLVRVTPIMIASNAKLDILKSQTHAQNATLGVLHAMDLGLVVHAFRTMC